MVYGKWVFVALWVVLFMKSPVKHYGLGFEFKTVDESINEVCRLYLKDLKRKG